jgi:two-component system, LytTR family, sensor kinase
MLGYKSTKQFLTTYALIVVVGFLAFLVRLVKFDQFTLNFHINITLLSIVLAAIFWEALRGANNWLNKFYPFEKNITNRIILQLIIGCVIGIIIRAGIYTYGEPRVPIQLDSMFLAATWALYIIIPTGVNLGFFTVYFINRWKASIIYAERLEKEKSQVQFDNLKNQLNPHFLFNALTSLNSLIFENQQLASDFLQQLSRVYRYVLQNKDKNFVLLTTELEFISNYVKLLETRFAGSLQIIFNIEDQNRQKAIVPVTLQILIENAIKHNIVDQHKPLTIEITTIGDYLIVSNNLQTKKRVETSNKQGLENLKSLYKFLTDEPVIVENTDNRFYVKVPLISS